MKTSFSALSKWMNCPYEYFLYYEERIRPSENKSAFFFGGAIDESINTLLLTKDVDKAKEHFNNIFTDVPGIKYNEDDIDAELLTEEEYSTSPAFHSLRKKGLILIDGFNNDILPKIKRVVEVQKELTVKNDVGDELVIKADLIVEWEDDTTILLDTKTSIRPYDYDAASKSIQLTLYFDVLEKMYGITKIGFLVLNKILKKNRIKICKQCGYDGSGASHKTCPNIVQEARCKGEWTETISPTANTQIIINEPNKNFLDMVVEMVDNGTYNIKGKNFYRNLNSCKKGKYLCDYYKLCHEKKMDGLVKK